MAISPESGSCQQHSFYLKAQFQPVVLVRTVQTPVGSGSSVVGICVADHCLLCYLYVDQKIGGVFGIIKRLRKKKNNLDLVRKNSPVSF